MKTFSMTVTIFNDFKLTDELTEHPIKNIKPFLKNIGAVLPYP